MSKSYIVVPHGKDFREHHGPVFESAQKARDYAEEQCAYWSRTAHYQVFVVSPVWTTQTLEEAAVEATIPL